MILKQGKLRGERCEYPDGTIGMCVWYPMGGNDDTGMCFDFDGADSADMVALVSQLINTEPKVIVEEEVMPVARVNPVVELVRRVMHPLGWWLLGR